MKQYLLLQFYNGLPNIKHVFPTSEERKYKARQLIRDVLDRFGDQLLLVTIEDDSVTEFEWADFEDFFDPEDRKTLGEQL